jgi:hypothetical protein
MAAIDDFSPNLTCLEMVGNDDKAARARGFSEIWLALG